VIVGIYPAKDLTKNVFSGLHKKGIALGASLPPTTLKPSTDGSLPWRVGAGLGTDHKKGTRLYVLAEVVENSGLCSVHTVAPGDVFYFAEFRNLQTVDRQRRSERN
jgi:hypothetical protein